MASYLAETNAWSDSNYFGNLDSAYIPGVSIAMADSNLYDGIVSDFLHFQLEKFPQDPLQATLQTNLPPVTNNLYTSSDFIDSDIPEFSSYVVTDSQNEI